MKQMEIETWCGAPDGGVHAGQWGCDTSAIYKKKGQTWWSREAKKNHFYLLFQTALQLSVLTGGLLLNR